MNTKSTNSKIQKRNLGGKTKLLVVALLLLGSLAANAQINLPGGDDNVPDAPIDGFLAIGLIAGACIGLHKRIRGLKE